MGTFCFPPSAVIQSPPLTPAEEGAILNWIGGWAETVIDAHYLQHVGRPDFFPNPPRIDFRDGVPGRSSKDVYLEYLFEKNPGLDRQKARRLANEREIRGKDGQILYIPDIMTHDGETTRVFYEIKPNSKGGEKDGELKIAAVRAFCQELGLSYTPGKKWNPDIKEELFTGLLLGHWVTVYFHFKRHEHIDGLIVYEFCVEFKLAKELIVMAIAILIIAMVIYEMWRRRNEGVPPGPPKELPAPVPKPWPIPKPEIPIPIPRFFKKG